MDRYNFEQRMMELLRLPPATLSFELVYTAHSAQGAAQVKVFHYKKDDKGNYTDRLTKTVYDLFEDE
jgi:hypothetical protein